MIIQDLEYYHLLYNTFGPITCHVPKHSFIKIQTNNGTGKTIVLKTILGLILPWSGTILNQGIKKTKELSPLLYNRLSNSQSKKFKIINSIFYKKVLWVLDEPYSFMDITSINFVKKKIIVHHNKKGMCILTDCIKKTLLPTLIFYYGLKWI